MRPSTPRLLIALFAAPLMLASPLALAGGGGGGGGSSSGAQACGNIELLASGNCQYEVSGGCQTMCTPPDLVAACDGQCSADPMVTCTGGCEASCEASCTPASIDCEGDCTSNCDAGCMTVCSDTACQTDCQHDCANRCQVSCNVKPPNCTASCQASCNASCTVQANINCHEMCTVSLQGGCQTQCEQPQGALFCNNQYVNISASNFAACEQYLAEQGLNVTTTTTCGVNGCTTTVGGLGCGVAPAVGAVDERLGAGAVAALMMGLGLVVARRRRRA